MRRHEILAWLLERDEERLSFLWRLSDDVRRVHVGSGVHLRGLVEISNHCRRTCAYCGLRVFNRGLPRYRMCVEEILACARRAARLGIGTVVLQAGEDPRLDADWVSGLVRSIKRETRLAVTLSLGERTEAELSAWRRSGADRYLLRFETSNPDLYRRYHPPLSADWPDRLALLRVLRELGYETGAGMMVGLPGQTPADLVSDIALLEELDPDMIGLGPFIPHPATPLGRDRNPRQLSFGDQVPADDATVFKVLALARLACPDANIPATTAITALDRSRGLELALRRGANVFMPNLTPARYRVLYDIYPGHDAGPEASFERIRCRITALGRSIVKGRGDSRRRMSARQAVLHSDGA